MMGWRSKVRGGAVWAGVRPFLPTAGVLAAGALLGSVLISVQGCGSNFFQCENKPACPATGSTGTTGTTTTVDFAFVSYTTTDGSSVVTGYDLASGALTAINTVTLPFVPIAMAVNPANSLLYVASVPGATNPGIYAYSIATDGTLAAANNGSALVTDLVGAMSISPDGGWLFTLQSTGQTMTEYSVNSSTGVLSSSGALIVPALGCAPAVGTPVLPSCSIAVSPVENYVVASLGTAGDAVFGYTTSAGITNNGAFSQIAAGTNSGDFSAVLDGSNNLYVAQTATMTAYGLSSSGNTNRGTYTYPTGSVPRSAVVDGTSKFVYTANVGTGKISGFATGTTTALTTLSGAPYAAPNKVAALGIDSTNSYLVAAGYDATAGVQLYSIATTGVLTAGKTAATSTATQYPVLVAMSH